MAVDTTATGGPGHSPRDTGRDRKVQLWRLLRVSSRRQEDGTACARRACAAARCISSIRARATSGVIMVPSQGWYGGTGADCPRYLKLYGKSYALTNELKAQDIPDLGLRGEQEASWTRSIGS